MNRYHTTSRSNNLHGSSAPPWRSNNNNNNKKGQRRRRHYPLPITAFGRTQTSLLVLGTAACSLFLLLGTTNRTWRIHHVLLLYQRRAPSSTTTKASSSVVPIISKPSVSTRKQNVKVQRHPFVDASFHLSNTRIEREKEEQQNKNNNRIPATRTTTTTTESVAEQERSTTIHNNNNNNNNSHHTNEGDITASTACRGKERLVEILVDAGLSLQNATKTCPELPTWDTVTSLYGSEPVFVRHQCQRNKERPPQQVPPLQPRVAGLYNTGTNALVKLLPLNLPQSMWAVAPDEDDEKVSESDAQPQQQKKKRKRTYFDWDVPWGKHNPPREFYYNQGNNISMPGQQNVSIHDILPVIVVKDPYWWMQSVCRNRYGIKWKQQPASKGHERCPYLIDTTKNVTTEPVPISVHRTIRRKEYVQDYASLLHLWTDFYGQYISSALLSNDDNNESSSPAVVDFPFIVVRFEDILFHGPTVLDAIADCANGYSASPNDDNNSYKKRKPFSYFLPKSKSHGKTSTDFVSAIIKYGNRKGRTNGMLEEDLQFAEQHLRQQPKDDKGRSLLAENSSSLMQLLHYQTA